MTSGGGVECTNCILDTPYIPHLPKQTEKHRYPPPKRDRKIKSSKRPLSSLKLRVPHNLAIRRRCRRRLRPPKDAAQPAGRQHGRGGPRRVRRAQQEEALLLAAAVLGGGVGGRLPQLLVLLVELGVVVAVDVAVARAGHGIDGALALLEAGGGDFGGVWGGVSWGAGGLGWGWGMW